MSKSVNKVALIAIIAVCSLAIGYVYQKYRVAPAIAFPNLEALDAQGSRVKIQPKPGQSLIVVF